MRKTRHLMNISQKGYMIILGTSRKVPMASQALASGGECSIHEGSDETQHQYFLRSLLTYSLVS